MVIRSNLWKRAKMGNNSCVQSYYSQWLGDNSNVGRTLGSIWKAFPEMIQFLWVNLSRWNCSEVIETERWKLTNFCSVSSHTWCSLSQKLQLTSSQPISSVYHTLGQCALKNEIYLHEQMSELELASYPSRWMYVEMSR